MLEVKAAPYGELKIRNILSFWFKVSLVNDLVTDLKHLRPPRKRRPYPTDLRRKMEA